MLQALPDETAKRLASAQVAVSPDTVVKELVENALDAGSTSVQVRVKDAGLALISVKDDGCGVAPEDVPLLLQRYTTSKIASFDDLASVRTFGFRALNSIASLSVRTVVSTRVASEGSGRCYEFDRNRRMTGESAKAMQVGTQIEVEKLFHHLPVRKQSFAKQSTQVCKRIRDIMIGFALLFPKVRISVKFERTSSKSGPAGDDAANSITKSAVSTTLDAVRAVFGSALPKCLASFAAETSISPENAEWESHDERERISCQRIQIDALIPHKDHRSDAVVWKSSSDHCFVYVNSRRTALSSDPTIRELVARVRRRCAEGLDESKYPFMWIHIQLPVELTDVNIEPDKTTVKLRFPDQVLRW
ncbi:ATP-binding mismatch repair protein [Polyrhizophydium stewartii]|uniref:ATP-binding mismatch repair protein n=1 Tax=Polyrhizophydium stewartii TaxID=2732419 RepID=A0ABR4NGU7_9FUNG